MLPKQRTIAPTLYRLARAYPERLPYNPRWSTHSRYAALVVAAKIVVPAPKTTKLSDCQMPPVSVLSATATGYRAITSFSACWDVILRNGRVLQGLFALSSLIAEPCRTGGLVPGMREIKGSMLGRLLYYLVWQLSIALLFFLFFLLYSTLLIIAYIIIFVVVFFILLSCNCFFILLSYNYFLYFLLYSFNCCILLI